VRSCDAGYGIGNSGPGGDKAHTGFVGRPGISIRRVHGRLLMTNEDMLELVLLEQFVVNVKNRAARIAENVLDPLLLQAPDYYFRAS
jgi:hypothetical protein